MIAYVVVPAGKDITQSTATKLYIALLVMCLLGTSMLFFLGKPVAGRSDYFHVFAWRFARPCVLVFSIDLWNVKPSL